MDNLKLGTDGERAALKFLKRKGFRVLERNFRAKGGEIDLICLNGECIVFVEVKSRSSFNFGHPVEAITEFKKEKLLKTAYLYLTQKNLIGKPFRFDLVSIVWGKEGKIREISHLKNFLEGN
jgi:putative endonuclease